MTEDLIPFELDKKLKEKGYRNYASYWDYTPTISQVLKWLREENKIHVCISYSDNLGSLWDYEVVLLDGAMYQNSKSDFLSYEAAAIAGIEYVIDNLI